MADTAAKKKPMSDSLAKIPDNISVSFLPNAKTLSKQVLGKGLNYYTQSYIHDVKVSDGNEDICVTARCWRSMRKNQPPHKLHLFIKGDTVDDCYCSCTVGINGQCSHIVGLLKTLQGLKLHNFTNIPAQQSSTSVPHQWHIPRGTKIKPVPVNHVIVTRPSQTRKRKPVLCQIDTNYKLPEVTKEDFELLASLKGTPLAIRMSADIPTMSTPLGSVQIGSVLSYQTRNLKGTHQSVQGCCDTNVNCSAPINLSEEFND